MRAERPDLNPYVGPRPFGQSERARFFGRAHEVRDLLSLVLAQRVVLLYAASGAGKSSLLNAGLIPLLEEEKGFDVLPVARLLSDRNREASSGTRNVFASALLASWSAPTDASSIADYLGSRERPLDGEGFPGPRAIVVDQFEELFTLYPDRWSDREPLFAQVCEALDSDPFLRVILVLREEWVAQLDPYAALLPGRLRTRFRLERLDRDGALAAITGPLEGAGCSFAPGVAESLVTDLLTLRIDAGGGHTVETQGEFVEPVQLQVVCRSLWSELPPGVTEVTTEHLRALGNIDEVLAGFYDVAVAAALTAARTDELRLRAWIEDELITSGGTRGTVYRAAGATADMANEVLDELEEKRLVRAEWRAGARWYELTHDRLIEPIRESNARYRAAIARKQRRKRTLLASLLAIVVGALIPSLLFIAFGGEDGVSSVQISPSSIDFGPVQANEHLEQIITLGSSINFQIRSISTTSTEFLMEQSDCSRTLSPGGSCAITIRFAPTRPGPVSGELRVVPEKGRPLIAALRGTGE